MKRLTFVIWTLALFLSNQCAWAADGDVWLDPASPSVGTGTNFTLAVRVDSGSSEVGAYNFSISFDPTYLQVNSGVGSSGVQAGVDIGVLNFIPNLNNGAGTLTITGANFTVNPGPSGANLHLLTINFTSLAVPGITPVGLGVTDLTNEIGVTIGTPSGQGSTVTINGPPTTTTTTTTTAPTTTTTTGPTTTGPTTTTTTGPTTTTTTGPTTTTTTIPGLRAANPIPTLSVLGIPLLASLLAGLGLYGMFRRQQ